MSGASLRADRRGSAAGPVAVALLALAAAALSFTASIGLARISLGGLGVAALTVLCVWLVSSERYELTLAVVALYVGLLDGYLRLRTGVSELTLVRDLLFYSIVVGALARLALRRAPLRLPPLGGWVLAFAAVALVQLLNPANEDVLYSLAALRPHLEWVPLFFFGYAVMRTTGRLRGFLVLLTGIAAVNGAVGLLQSSLTPEQLARWGLGYEELLSGSGGVAGRGFVDETGAERVRPFALGSDFGFAGTLGLLAAPAAFALLSLAGRHRWLLVTAPLAAAIAAGVVTSQSRTAVVAAAISLVAYVALTTLSARTGRLVVGLTVGAAISFFALSQIVDRAPTGLFDRYDDIAPAEVVGTTLEYRERDLALVPAYAVDFPFGAGLGSGGPATALADEDSGLSAEGQVNYLLIELGIPGLLVLLGLLITLLGLALARMRHVPDAETRLLLAAVAAPLFAQAATWVVGIATSSTPGAPYFWFAAGILAFWLVDRSPVGRGEPARHYRFASRPLGGAPPVARAERRLRRSVVRRGGDNASSGAGSLPAVTVVAHDVGPVGGMERQLTRLIEGLSALGHRIRVVSRSCHVAHLSGVRWIRVPGPSRPFPLASTWFFLVGSAIVAMARRGVVHSTGAIVANRVDVVTVHFCHHAIAEQPHLRRSRSASPIYRLNAGLSSALARLAERLCYRPGRVRRVIGVGEGVTEQIAGHFPDLGSLTETIPNGVDDRLFELGRQPRGAGRAELELDGSDLVAVFVGSEWERKGLREAIEALASAPRWRLVVVGDGDRARYERLAGSLSLGDRVRFTGLVDDPAPYYAAADAFVLPTSYEGFSLASLEAAAAGLPLVMTDAGEARELLEDGESGVLVSRSGASVADALRRLEDDELRLAMGDRSRTAAAPYRWGDVVRRYSALYRSLRQDRVGARDR